MKSLEGRSLSMARLLGGNEAQMLLLERWYSLATLVLGK